MDTGDVARFYFLDAEVGPEFEIVRKMVKDGVFAGTLALFVIFSRHEFTMRDGFIKGGLVGEHHPAFLT